MTPAELLTRNTAANEAYVKLHYPNEIFLSTTEQLQAISRWTKKLILPENVKIARSRAFIKSNEQQRTLKKELKQAGIISILGKSVFLTPEYGLYKVPETDAIIDGIPFEFRNITGQIRKIELRFREAKKKGNKINVFMNIEINVNIDEVKRRINLVLGRHPEYTGKIIVSLGGEPPYFWDTSTIRAICLYKKTPAE